MIVCISFSFPKTSVQGQKYSILIINQQKQPTALSLPNSTSSSFLANRFTHLIMSSTSLFSAKPSLLQLLISILSITLLCSPEDPLAWQFISLAILSMPSRPSFWISLGRRMWTEPLMQVPRLEGQQVTIPQLGLDMNTLYLPVIFLMPSSTAPTPLESLSNTDCTLPPFYMEMILRWSPSLTHIMNFSSSETKIPLPWGQSTWQPDAACILSPPLNKQCLSISSLVCSGVMSVCRQKEPARSPVKPFTTFSTRLAIYSLVCLVPAGFRGKKLRFRATLILVVIILLRAVSSNLVVILELSMSVTCFIVPSSLQPL